ncbi:MAG: hypothetical protein K2N16_06165 [Muribaculaceae bacterium]|nr:hypothetical protein [Muribaculaceae bacterium]
MNAYAIYAKQLLQLVLSPSRGWEDIVASGSDPSKASARLMMPAFVLAAVSDFLRLIFDSELALSEVVIGAVVTFVAYFVSFAISVQAFRTRLGKYLEVEPDKERNLTVIVYTMTLLAMSTIVCNATPFSAIMSYILPLLIGLVAWKSAALLRVKPDSEFGFAGFVMMFLALPPVVIQSAFAWILAKA